MPSASVYQYGEEKKMDKSELEELYGEVFNTSEVQVKYQIESFLAPFCFAKERETGKDCVLQFQHEPRFYWFVKYN